MAKIDFVVPCYNYARYLPTCISSLLQQSVSDLRVLIVNDKSPDDTADVAEALAAADSRVSVLHHEKNQGMVASINDGIAWAESEYLLLLSADDMLAPGAVARAIDVLDNNADLGMVYGNCPMFTDETVPVFDPANQTAAFEWRRYDGQELIKTFCKAPSNFIQTPTCIVRTALQKQLGGYAPQLPHCCDFEMWLRFAAHGAIGHIQTIQGYRRDHPGVMNKQYFAERWPDFYQRRETFDYLFAKQSERIPSAPVLHAQVRKELAEDGYWTAVKLLVNGRFGSAAKMFKFAVETEPAVKYRPPLGWLLKRVA